jgi:hypothetical protein
MAPAGSYSGSRDQEDLSSKPARANGSQDSCLKKTSHKNRAGEVAQGVGLEFKPHFVPTKKKKKKKSMT